jgi:uncharacterized protein DUF4349
VSVDIDYLQELRADLMEAATRATAAAPQVSPTRRVRQPVARWKLVSGLAATSVVVAGIVGFLATGGAPSAERLAIAGQEPRPADGNGGGPVRGNIDAGHHLPEIIWNNGRPQPGAPAPVPSAAPSAASPPGDGVPVVGPNIVKTAEIEVRVDRDTFVTQFEKATRIAENFGGYVQTSSTSGTKTHIGTMTMRVPADKFALALAEIRALGRVLHQEITGVDVTSQFVDLGARLQNAEAQETSLRRLLAKAPTVDATLKVNRVLSDTELRIEELQGQLRVLQNRSDLGTIHLAMEEQGAKVAPPVTNVKNPKLTEAFHKGVAGFLGVVFSVVVGIGYLLPVLVVALVVWFVVRRIRRSRMATA